MESAHDKRHREFKKDLAAVINKHGIDNDCNTPDFVLADVCYYSLQTFHEATAWREQLKNPVGPVEEEVSQSITEKIWSRL